MDRNVSRADPPSSTADQEEGPPQGQSSIRHLRVPPPGRSYILPGGILLHELKPTGPRFRGAGPWPDGQFYVWDVQISGIRNPDSGEANSPWRKMYTKDEADRAAADLNQLENDYAMQALR